MTTCIHFCETIPIRREKISNLRDKYRRLRERDRDQGDHGTEYPFVMLINHYWGGERVSLTRFDIRQLGFRLSVSPPFSVEGEKPTDEPQYRFQRPFPSEGKTPTGFHRWSLSLFLAVETFHSRWLSLFQCIHNRFSFEGVPGTLIAEMVGRGPSMTFQWRSVRWGNNSEASFISSCLASTDFSQLEIVLSRNYKLQVSQLLFTPFPILANLTSRQLLVFDL